jgi:hypothetical protein
VFVRSDAAFPALELVPVGLPAVFAGGFASDILIAAGDPVNQLRFFLVFL